MKQSTKKEKLLHWAIGISAYTLVAANVAIVVFSFMYDSYSFLNSSFRSIFFSLIAVGTVALASLIAFGIIYVVDRKKNAPKVEEIKENEIKTIE